MATAVAVKGKNSGRSEVSSMQTFSWVGTDKRGMKMRGQELGKNENIVKAELRRRGINPTSVAVKKDSIFGSGAPSSPKILRSLPVSLRP